MRMWGHLNVLSPAEEEGIHRAALTILDQIGVVVESKSLLDCLAEFGGRVDPGQSKITFATDVVERFLSESERYDWEAVTPVVEGRVHVYFGCYLNPETDEREPWRIETLLDYLKVAHYLEHTSGRISYAFPVDGIPEAALLPFFNYLTLKFTGISIASVNSVQWAPVVVEMCEAAAAERGVPLNDVLKAHVHMISPLKLTREEAEIFEFFRSRGIRMGMGHMESAGGTAPVTLAGAVALGLAHGLFTSMVRRACYGDKGISLGCYVSPLDMRTGIYACGRPEKEICNVAMAQMARRYGASYRGHTGHTDAKRPSVEAGFQRALNSIPTLMACGQTTISCGQLSVDEVFSPLQLIIDNEMVSALKHFMRGFEVNEETLALEVIREVGPGGNFLAADHTANHFRSELWEPRVFEREMLSAWERSGAKADTDKALDIYREIIQRDPPPVHISEAMERTLLQMIQKTSGTPIAPVLPR